MSLNTFNTMNEIAEYIIKNFPDIQSGTKQTINDLINLAIQEVENAVEETIDVNNIPQKYQSIITDLSYARVLVYDVSQDSTGKVELGDLSVDSGQTKKLTTAKGMRDMALSNLRELRRRIKFKRVIGA